MQIHVLSDLKINKSKFFLISMQIDWGNFQGNRSYSFKDMSLPGIKNKLLKSTITFSLNSTTLISKRTNYQTKKGLSCQVSAASSYSNLKDAFISPMDLSRGQSKAGRQTSGTVSLVASLSPRRKAVQSCMQRRGSSTYIQVAHTMNKQIC